MNLEKMRITVSGGEGFLGRHLVKKLIHDRGCQYVSIADLPEYDLRKAADIRRMFKRQNPELFIHLAAVVGGIGANRDNPAVFFYDNALMGIQLLHEAYLAKIRKFVAIGTICAYPKFTPVPFKEEDIWNGFPEETNAPYGLAKRMLLVQSQAYRKQYNFNSIYLLPVNLYGPGDKTDAATSHVIPALIQKCLSAVRNGDDHIVVWGSGEASREFLYVEDAAQAIIMATERYDESEPVNLGTGVEVKIKDLVSLICRLTGFQGGVVWDISKPDGQPRRRLDISRATSKFGFKAETGLETGLKKTIEWTKSVLDE